MKKDNTATIMHTPKGVGNLYRTHFCHDELANLKERCTDEVIINPQNWSLLLNKMEMLRHGIKNKI